MNFFSVSPIGAWSMLDLKKPNKSNVATFEDHRHKLQSVAQVLVFEVLRPCVVSKSRVSVRLRYSRVVEKRWMLVVSKWRSKWVIKKTCRVNFSLICPYAIRTPRKTALTWSMSKIIIWRLSVKRRCKKCGRYFESRSSLIVRFWVEIDKGFAKSGFWKSSYWGGTTFNRKKNSAEVNIGSKIDSSWFWRYFVVVVFRRF